MAIRKEATNIKVLVNNEYMLQAGSITETADQICVESYKENLVLESGKKVNLHGEDGGVKFSEYTPPELIIEESTYTLESRFALEQLFQFAEKDSLAMFSLWMVDIFGGDIPPEAYQKLYQEAKNKKEDLNPPITVAVNLPENMAAYYTGDKQPKYKNHIIVSQGFIDNARKYKEDQCRLLIALVEEFGHHLDYLLRVRFSQQGGDAPGDEGARYTDKMNRRYRKYLIDPFQQKEQHYATATINGEQVPLIWDFSELNQKLLQYVEKRKEKDDHLYAGFEFFGAGEGDDLHGFGHAHIEYEAFYEIYDPPKGEKAALKTKQIYFGNWLRDFSQFVDPMVVRPMANMLDMLSEENKKGLTDLSLENIIELIEENRVTKNDSRTYMLPSGVDYETTYGIPHSFSVKYDYTAFCPVKLSREAITTLVELIGIKEFGKLKEETDGGPPQNFMQYLLDFRSQYAPVTTKLLGVYKPNEHIDNPAALLPKEGKSKDLNHQLDEDFVKDPVDSQWNNNPLYGTKNYVRGNGPDPFPSAYDTFLSFIDQSNPDTVEGRIHFGAAMHILEDYFAHSNFCELAVMKVWNPKVFPWDNLPESCKKELLENQKADAGSNRHAGHSVISDRSKIRFNTLDNPSLYAPGLKEFLRNNPGKTPKDYYKLKGLSYSGNRGTYYSHAECAVVQTGSFGMLDTLASIAPKITDKFLSITLEDPKKLKEGERTFSDALIYEMLKDISMAQAVGSYKNNTLYQGKEDNAYSKAFLGYLEMRDFLVAERFLLAGYSLSDIPGLFGLIEYINGYLKVIKNVFYHYLALAAINMIDDYQTSVENQLEQLEKGTWKVADRGPTHTQLAKDNGQQPLHNLSIELATEAVKRMGNLFNERKYDKIKDMAEKVFFVHPVLTDWMDPIVINWCRNKDNQWKLRMAEEASVVLYGLYNGQQEIVELMNELKLIRDEHMDEGDDTQKFDAQHRNINTKWYSIDRKIRKMWEEKGLDKNTALPAPGASDYEKHKKEKGYNTTK